jgi:membrane associated rhomboid family serine protease
MILAYLEGIPRILKAPVTWLLIFLNVAVQIASAPFDVESSRYRRSITNDEVFVKTQGSLYAHYIIEKPTGYSDYIVDVAALATLGNTDKIEILGHLAFQDSRFLNEAQEMKFPGDQVAYEYWKEEVKTYQEAHSLNPKHVFGLVNSGQESYRWITYLFIHDGIAHLVFNMWFLLIFGGYLERRIGSIWFLASYLAAGVFAAMAFEVVSGLTGMPLVGASGAISGLMGAFVVIAWNKRLKFKMDAVEPEKASWVLVPAWFDIAAWMILDLGGYLQSLKELGGVAHITHMGGLLFGLVFAAIFMRSKIEAAGIEGLKPKFFSRQAS